MSTHGFFSPPSPPFFSTWLMQPDAGAQELDATVDDVYYYSGGAYYYVQPADDDQE